MKKVVKSKVAAQKWLWWSDNGKIFNNNNSGKFVTTVWLFWCRLFITTTLLMITSCHCMIIMYNYCQQLEIDVTQLYMFLAKLGIRCYHCFIHVTINSTLPWSVIYSHIVILVF